MNCPEVDCGGDGCHCRKKGLDPDTYTEQLFWLYVLRTESKPSDIQAEFMRIVKPIVTRLARHEILTSIVEASLDANQIGS